MADKKPPALQADRASANLKVKTICDLNKVEEDIPNMVSRSDITETCWTLTDCSSPTSKNYTSEST